MLCLIPARSGSTLKDKNIRLLNGKPLIAYSIEHGLASGADRVIVSTDSIEYAKIAEHYGAEVMLRPQSLAMGCTTDWEVFYHTLNVLKKENYHPIICLHLRPTSPIRRVVDIQNMVRMCYQPGVTAVRSIQKATETPYKMWHRTTTWEIRPVIPGPEYCNAPRQLLPKVFKQNGCIDVIKTSTIMAGSMTGHCVLGYYCDGVDIDTEDDFIRAERMMQNATTATDTTRPN